jgi:hypothetical protein
MLPNILTLVTLVFQIQLIGWLYATPEAHKPGWFALFLLLITAPRLIVWFLFGRVVPAVALYKRPHVVAILGGTILASSLSPTWIPCIVLLLSCLPLIYCQQGIYAHPLMRIVWSALPWAGFTVIALTASCIRSQWKFDSDTFNPYDGNISWFYGCTALVSTILAVLELRLTTLLTWGELILPSLIPIIPSLIPSTTFPTAYPGMVLSHTEGDTPFNQNHYHRSEDSSGMANFQIVSYASVFLMAITYNMKMAFNSAEWQDVDHVNRIQYLVFSTSMGSAIGIAIYMFAPDHCLWISPLVALTSPLLLPSTTHNLRKETRENPYKTIPENAKEI